MVERTMAVGDPVAFRRTCPHCGRGYDDNPVVFEPLDQTFSLHRSCMEELVGVRVSDDEAKIRAEFERRRAELLDRDD